MYFNEVIDIIGRKVLSLPLAENSGKVELNTAAFAEGQYIVVLRKNDTVVEQVKLIVNN